MAIDQVPESEHQNVEWEHDSSGFRGKFLLIFAVLAALAVGEFYMIHKTNSVRSALAAEQVQANTQLRSDFQEQLGRRLTAMQNANAQQMDDLKYELDAAAKRLGTTGGELKRARATVAQLQNEQHQQAAELEKQLASKADQQQLGALNQDVSAQRTDLDNTKKALDGVRSDLGMARSDLGTLIARNHDEIAQLRRLGERDYFEFTAERKAPAHVAGIGLTLTKTNVKRHRFNMLLMADDISVEKKDRTINEPIFFYVDGSKQPYELVVNQVTSNQVKGYVSAPKGASEGARAEGGR